jgi:hypothetical protein
MKAATHFLRLESAVVSGLSNRGRAALRGGAIVLAAAAGAVQAAGAVDELFSFDDEIAGAPPTAFFFAAARQAAPGKWEIRGTTNKHLIHSADPAVTMRGMSLAASTTPAPANIRLSARVRAVDVDRAGGLVWRMRDANNFYFMGLVFADRTIGLFRVTGGNRILLDVVPNIDLDAEAWHTLSVTHEGDQIRGTVNGLEVLRARDNNLAEGGRAGVWSAGNSTTWFDDIAFNDAAALP